MSLNIDSVCEKRVFWSKDIVCAPLELPQNNGSSWPVASSHTFSGSFNGADFPSNRPLPLLYNSIMYLKCLLHNLCSINVCFKGCDTTSAHYFPGLCSFSAVCLSPDQDISLSVSSDFNCISDDDDERGTICTHPTRISSSFCKCVWTCWSTHACIVTKPKRVLVLLLWICCRLKEPQLMCWMQYRVRCLHSGASESCRAAKCEVSCISWMLELGCSVPSGRDGRGGALEPVPALQYLLIKRQVKGNAIYITGDLKKKQK